MSIATHFSARLKMGCKCTPELYIPYVSMQHFHTWACYYGNIWNKQFRRCSNTLGPAILSFAEKLSSSHSIRPLGGFISIGNYMLLSVIWV